MTGKKVLIIGIVVSVMLTCFIWLGGKISENFLKLPDQGISWYYWKLAAPNFWSRATAWSLYLSHQLSLWLCIYWAQKKSLEYRNILHSINYLIFAVNTLFIILHFLQTYLFYDGLAQDVPIWSSLGAVTLLLVFVLILETPRRGLFFGHPVTFKKEFIQVIKRYHGYFFSFAAIYTFWYHPMEATGGHLIGFLYMFFLLLQSSLIFNPMHLNHWWTFLLEIMVIFHSLMVIFMQRPEAWSKFFFGFLGILLITQLHGLPIGHWIKRSIYGAFLLSVIGVYGFTELGLGQMHEIIRIPIIEYVLVGLIYVIFLSIFCLISHLSKLKTT
jgi:hypothetical protein